MMIKKLLSIIILSLVFTSSLAQGWRKNEMEVKVLSNGSRDLEKIAGLGLDFEPISTDGSAFRMYLIPHELELLKQSNLRYEVTIADMNRHFEHFWDDALVPPGYYTYEEIIAIADSLATNFPVVCKKITWGTSMGGRQLASLKISDNAGNDEPEPEIMFDGGIHGDEVGGSQNIIMFARDLCLGYGSDPAITDIVNGHEIWLYLMVNPDGRVSMSRYNNNGVDCNRDNGYMWNAEGNSPGAFSQVETKALRNCILDNQFVVYSNYHSGTEIISYPWSYRSATARDYEHINQLAVVYATASGYTSLQYGQGYNIMYPINGSTKDFQYGSLGNIGWSIEISVAKQPPSSQISYYYNANKPAMLELISRCGWGLSGMVTDSVTGAPVRATVWVNDYFPVYNDPVVGDYHKYLLPGTFTLKVTANGYQTRTITNVTVPSQGAAIVNVQLSPAPSRFAYKVMSCQIPGNNFGDEGYTPGALGPPDSIPYSLGKNGWIVLDMGDTIFDGPGADFKIIQAGTIVKDYTVSGGNSMDGPFATIGVGNGTTSFDLGLVSIAKARYLRIKDNGVGPAYGTGAGFNLDAVEMLTVPVVADFTSTTGTPCQGSMVDFSDNSTGNPTSWEWIFPGGIPSSSNAQNPGNIWYGTPGAYDVSLTVSNGNTSGSIIKPGFISVITTPAVNLGSDTTLCAWSSIVLDAGNPGAGFLWSTGATTQTILADSTGVGSGSQDIWVQVAGTDGCSTSDSIRITFDPCTGLPGVEGRPVFTVSPNPACNFFTLDITGFNGGRWCLISLTGARVAEAEIPREHYHTTVEVGGLPGGLYLMKVMKDDLFLVKKIILSPFPGK